MKQRSLVVGIVLVGLVVATAVVSLVWTPWPVTAIDPGAEGQGPSVRHWLGTDRLGFDLASGVMAGARTGLLVGVVAVGIAAVVGVPLGMVAGMRGGWLDSAIMRLNDLLFAFPAVLLAILLAAVAGHGSTWTAMSAIGIAGIPAFARTTRAGTRRVMTADFIAAARISGVGAPTLAARHVLPSIGAVIGVQASVSFAMAILAEAALSYLGLGSPPTSPSWGRMLRDAQAEIFSQPLQGLWPGLAIAVTVLGFNLLGDGLRDFLDPRLKEVRPTT